MTIEIPRYGRLTIESVVLDYNGTLAKEGTLLPEVEPLLKKLGKDYDLYIVTADTFGTVEKCIAHLPLQVKILSGEDHTGEKRGFVESLGAAKCAAVGNGNNDARMLEAAALGIAVIGDEGCSTAALRSADLVCRHITEALETLTKPKRLVATLRR